jgi:ComF family protein
VEWGLGSAALIGHWVFPRVCPSCREDLPFPIGGPLCGPCLGRLRRLEEPLCRRCGRQWRGPGGPCADCRGRLWAVDSIRAVFPYRPPLPDLLYAFKYEGRPWVGRALAAWMAGAFRYHPDLGRADALVPVPLHPARERARGFNQAEVLAGAVGKSCGLSVLDALRRVRNTPPLWRIGRGRRREGLDGAFARRPGRGVRGLRLVLVDDVCTSGATLEACALELRGGGAASVRAFVLARG